MHEVQGTRCEAAPRMTKSSGHDFAEQNHGTIDPSVVIQSIGSRTAEGCTRTYRLYWNRGDQACRIEE